MAALAQRHAGDVGLEGPGQDIYLKAGMAYWNEAMTNPARLMEHQVQYWGKTPRISSRCSRNISHGQFTAPQDDPDLVGDKRFSNPLWRTHPYFNFVKHQVSSGRESDRGGSGRASGSRRDRQGAGGVFFSANQMIDLFSPTNYLATNPDALERAVETEA